MIAYLRVPKTGSTPLAFALIGNNIEYEGGHVTALSLVGHAHPHEYITMIRDPFQTRISLYYAYKRMDGEGRIAAFANIPGHLRDRLLIRQGATVEDFLAASRDNMFGAFYSGQDPSTFAYVGRVEEMTRSMELLKACMGFGPCSRTDANINPDHPVGEPYSTAYSEAQFITDNPDDYAAYNVSLDRFNTLCQQHGI
jgi:hypothetical protein